MMTYGHVLYKSGPYEVRLDINQYIVINTDTNIVEHKGEVLYECMRLARMFDTGVNMMLNPPPEWASKEDKIPIQAELQLN